MPEAEVGAPDRPVEQVRRELTQRMEDGAGATWTDEEFTRFALDAFRHQCEAVPLVGRFAELRDQPPSRVSRWEDIPAIPTSAFKRFDFHDRDRPVVRIFRTSGTTQGESARGRHFLVDLELYHASLVPTFRRFMQPEGGPHAIVALLPSPGDAPDSSLSHMAGVVTARLGTGEGGFHLHPETGLDVDGLHAHLRGLAAAGQPTLVLGTAFAFARWAEDSPDWTVTLPPGSAVMETGGFKGRTRAVSRERLHFALRDRLGLPPERIVGEYGMTEMLSQFYEPVLLRGDSARWFRGPPWVRTRILDPGTLEPVPEGEVGLLAHLDLANLYSVSSILTEDLGRTAGDGFELLGRAQDAEPRGCSLAVEELEGLAGE